MDLKREQTLISAAQKGNESAVTELYDAYADKIFRYIFYRVENRETAEDLTGEVFLRFVEGLPTYEARDVPLLVWLYRIARARVIDHYRERDRTGEDHDLESVTLHSEDDVDGMLMMSYHQEKVYGALKLLTPDQQQVILLRFIEGHNLQETADILEKSVGAIKVMQQRALQALKRILLKEGVVYGG